MPNRNISNWNFFKLYASDWGVLILVAIVCLVLEFVPPYQRYYFAGDQSISYPLLAQTVPTWLLVVLSFILPLLIMIVLCFTYRRERFELHHVILALLLSYAVTVMITSIVKVSVGRLRPDFLARCIPKDPQENNSQCTGDPSVIKEGRKSFPSGHSSGSFAGLGFLSLYLAGKLKTYDGMAYAWKFLIVLLPLIGAALIAISRVDDYWHHWQDVLVGGLIGLVVTFVSYSQYFMPLNGHSAGLPNLKRLDQQFESASMTPTSISPIMSSGDMERGNANASQHQQESELDRLPKS